MKAVDIRYTDPTVERGHSLERVRVEDEALKEFLDALLNIDVHKRFIRLIEGDKLVIIPAHSIIKITVRALKES